MEAGNSGIADRPEIVSAVLRAAASSLRPQAVFATSATASGHVMSERADLRDPGWERLVVRPGRGLGGRVIEEKRPISIGDYFDDSSITGDYRALVKAEKLRSIACVPILVNGNVEVLLYVGFCEIGAAGARAVDQVKHLAEIAESCLIQYRARRILAAQALQALRSDDPARLRAVAEHAGELLAGAEDRVHLTERQRQVLDLLGSGASNADIALRLDISEATVKEHVGNLCRKFDATSRLGIVSRAREAGLV